MSFYNMIFGANKMSDAILATLGLTRGSVGRFRDCYVEEDRIAVYTRNGGGNRYCSCLDSPEYGGKGCKNEPFEKEVDECEIRPGDAISCGGENCGPTYLGKETTHRHPTGRKIMETWYRCLKPESIECSCTGCTIQFRLRKHPLYITDRDDDFDCTYATIYFSFPPEFSDDLKKLASGEKFAPDKRWLDAIESLKNMVSA